MSEEDRLIGSRRAAEMLGIDRSTLLRWVQQGKISAADKWEGQTGGYRFAFALIARLAAQRRAA